MTYCADLDDECTSSVPDCGTCIWAIEFWKDEIEELEYDEDIQEYDPFDDFEDMACFINYIDEYSNDYPIDEDLIPLTEDELPF
ncbi:hypothetical protein DSECCO2_501890 [anaerobic digester metagenome]